MINTATLFLTAFILAMVQLILYIITCWKMPKPTDRTEVFDYIANQAKNGNIFAKLLIGCFYLMLICVALSIFI